jgi:type IV secretory pathway ATPase VirB11/archaellum biosynthesis ATPase
VRPVIRHCQAPFIERWLCTVATQEACFSESNSSSDDSDEAQEVDDQSDSDQNYQSTLKVNDIVKHLVDSGMSIVICANAGFRKTTLLRQIVKCGNETAK